MVYTEVKLLGRKTYVSLILSIAHQPTPVHSLPNITFMGNVGSLYNILQLGL